MKMRMCEDEPEDHHEEVWRVKAKRKAKKRKRMRRMMMR